VIYKNESATAGPFLSFLITKNRIHRRDSHMFSPFAQLRIYFKIWLLQRAVRALEAKTVKPAAVQNTPDLPR